MVIRRTIFDYLSFLNVILACWQSVNERTHLWKGASLTRKCRKLKKLPLIARTRCSHFYYYYLYLKILVEVFLEPKELEFLKNIWSNHMTLNSHDSWIKLQKIWFIFNVSSRCHLIIVNYTRINTCLQY